MKWWIRTGIVLFAMAAGFCRTPVVKVGSGDRVASSIRYVALGDSIAHGYGLSDPEKDSYVGQVDGYLEQNYDYVFTANLGTNGLRSEQLLDILTNPENEKYKKYRATLQHADIVTVSIGSNDLLHLVKLNRNFRDYVEEGDQMFREACQGFAGNFPKIIREIRSIAPEARIYANNIYNPCGDLAGFETLYNLAERYICLLNKTFDETPDFILVDIKEEFDNAGESLLNMAVSDGNLDPHPNKKGHGKIGTKVIQGDKKEQLSMEIRGVIFDLDGTLLDSTWVWKQVDRDFLGRYGYPVPDDYSDAIKAMGFEQVAEYTIDRFDLPLSVEEVMAEWNQMALRAYSEQVKLRQGTKELLLWLRDQGIPAGVATSNTAMLFTPCLKNNGIYGLFHSFTEGNEVDRGKEFPDIYIKAAGKLGCDPSSCVVFEDIIPALKGAAAGGFVTIGVREQAWGYEEREFGKYCDHIIYEITDAIALLKELE